MATLPPLEQSSSSDVHPDHVWPSTWRLIKANKPICGCGATRATFFDTDTGATLEWSTRDHRKGRYPTVKHSPSYTVRQTPFRLWAWFFGDVSWWVAFFFTIGSIFWCINGGWVLIPSSSTSSNETTEETYWIGATALLGGTCFLAGAIFYMWEVLNAPMHAQFGKVLAAEARELLPTNHKRAHFGRISVPEQGKHKYCQRAQHHIDIEAADRKRPATASAVADARAPASDQNITPASANGVNGKQQSPPHQQQQQQPPQPAQQQEWQWFGFRWRDFGFNAAFLQLIGATVFEISVICGFPQVLPSEADNVGLWNGVFWTPQVVGAPFFIISGLMFMLETQPTWLQIQPRKLGWHVGFWNAVGGVGFLLSGIFGYWSSVEEYQRSGMATSTFWGGWAFLLASYLQFVETINKH